MLIQIKITNCIQVCCAHPCFPHVYSRICHLQHVLCQLQTHQGATIDRLRELWNLQGCHGALGEKWCLFFILGFWGMDWPYLNQGSNVTCRFVFGNGLDGLLCHHHLFLETCWNQFYDYNMFLPWRAWFPPSHRVRIWLRGPRSGKVSKRFWEASTSRRLSPG